MHSGAIQWINIGEDLHSRGRLEKHRNERITFAQSASGYKTQSCKFVVDTQVNSSRPW